jgi:hypothetical protein
MSQIPHPSDPFAPRSPIDATPEDIDVLFWLYSLQVASGHHGAQRLSFYTVAAVLDAMRQHALRVRA